MRKTAKKKKASKATRKRRQSVRRQAKAKKLGTRKISIPWGSIVTHVLATPETRGLAGDLLKGIGSALRESADESIARAKEAKPDLRLVPTVWGPMPEKKPG